MKNRFSPDQRRGGTTVFVCDWTEPSSCFELCTALRLNPSSFNSAFMVPRDVRRGCFFKCMLYLSTLHCQHIAYRGWQIAHSGFGKALGVYKPKQQIAVGKGIQQNIFYRQKNLYQLMCMLYFKYIFNIFSFLLCLHI